MNQWILRTKAGPTLTVRYGNEAEITTLAARFAAPASSRVVGALGETSGVRQVTVLECRELTRRELMTPAQRDTVFGLEALPQRGAAA